MHGAVVLTPDPPAQDIWGGIPDDVFSEQIIWRALRITSGRERAACVWLRMRQLFPYWARYRAEPTRIQDRRMVIWRNVLAGYVFVPIPFIRTEIDSTYVKYCPGVLGWMKTGDKNVAQLTEDEIACIRRLEQAMQASAIAAVEGIPFKVGDKVRIKKYGIGGTIVEIASRREIKIEAPLGGALRIWTAPSSEIEAT